MKVGFFCDNTHREYPFRPGVTGALLPRAAIVDFGCLMGIGSGYDATQHGVYLHELRRIGDTFEFEFRSTAPGLSAYSLTFTRQESDDDYATEFAEAQLIDTEPEGNECDGGLVWSGYLVTGEMLLVSDALPIDITVSGGVSVEVEPALIQSLAGRSAQRGGGYVSAINIANTNRTQVSNPDGCKQPCFPGDQGYNGGDVVFTGVTCLTGRIRFREGYNSTIRQNTPANAIVFGAQVGSGAGEPCEEVPLFAGEAQPANSNYYGGGPACNEVLRSFNGVGGRLFQITAGQGVRITPSPASHKLLIDVDMHQLAVCHAETVSDTSCFTVDEYSDSSCACGPA